jgi:hypothetical protein
MRLDGDNNTGAGHSSTATTWADLSGNGNHATLNTTLNGNWTSNGFSFDGSRYFTVPQANVSANFPLGTNAVTTEVFYTGLGSLPAQSYLVSWGQLNSSSSYGLDILNDNTCAYWGNYADYSFDCPNNQTGNHTLTGTQNSGATSRSAYYDGSLVGSYSGAFNVSSGSIQIGARIDDINILTNAVIKSFRVYNRVLTDTEIAYNRNVDNYGTTAFDPKKVVEVLVGGMPCEVQSLTVGQLTCITSARTAGVVDVAISQVGNSPFTLTNAYTYFGMSPDKGLTRGGQTVEIILSAGLLGGVSASDIAVEFGGVDAGAITIVNATTISVQTPPHTAGKVDVAVDINGNVLNFPKSFTYMGVTPFYGKTTGGTEITVAGMRSLVGADSYITDDLVMQLDGENNTGSGYSNTATIWADLSGNNNNATLNTTLNSNWTANGFRFDGSYYFAVPEVNVSANFPLGTNAVTAEVSYVGSGSFGSFPYQSYLVSWGQLSSGSAYGLDVRNDNSCGYWGYYADYDFTCPNNQTGNHSITGTQNSGATSRSAYYDGSLVGSYSNGSGYFNVSSGSIQVGAYVGGTNMLTNAVMGSFRVYNRALLPAEIAQNAAVDEFRFGDPSLTVGGAPCDNAHWSGDDLVCNARAHAAGLVDIELDGAVAVGLDGAFAYVDFDPNEGYDIGGTEVVFTGGGFEAFDLSDIAVKFDGVDATDIEITSDTEITVKTPPHAVGAVNVSLTLGGQSLSWAGGFSYTARPDFISLSVSDPDVAIGGVPNVLHSDFVTVNVVTNVAAGYHLTVESGEPDLICASNSTYRIAAVNGTNGTLSNTWGYFVDDDGNSATVPSVWNWAGVTNSPVSFANSPNATSLVSGEDTVLWLGTKFNLSIPACRYNGTATITAVAN